MTKGISPVTIPENIKIHELKEKAIEKYQSFDQDICSAEDYVLLYPDLIHLNRSDCFTETVRLLFPTLRTSISEEIRKVVWIYMPVSQTQAALESVTFCLGKL